MNTNPGPISCAIRLRGKLDLERAAWFPELAHTEDGSDTLLVGELPDQAALMGILFRVHNLNLSLLCVKLQFPRLYPERDKDEQAI